MTREECIDVYGNREINSNSVLVGNVPSYYCHVLKLLWHISFLFILAKYLIPCRESLHCAHDCDLATLSKINILAKNFGLFLLAKQSSLPGRPVGPKRSVYRSKLRVYVYNIPFKVTL